MRSTRQSMLICTLLSAVYSLPISCKHDHDNQAETQSDSTWPAAADANSQDKPQGESDGRSNIL